MKKLSYIILALITIATSAVIIWNIIDKKDNTQIEKSLSKTNAERYPERYIGINAGCAQIYDNSYYEYLLSLAGKYPLDLSIFDLESPLRVALVNMLGRDRFAILNTYFLLQSPIVVEDKWVALEFMWPHLAYRSVTIFIDTINRLMYVEWVDPDESELLLFYELNKGEIDSPATILNRVIPESMRANICYGLLPDFDSDKTINEELFL